VFNSKTARNYAGGFVYSGQIDTNRNVM